MALEVSLGIAHANVRKVALRSSVARFDNDASVYVCAHPLTPPRLWHQVAEATLAGFFDSGQPIHSTPDSVRAAAARAAQRVAGLRQQLIETSMTVDAQLGAVAYDGRELHVLLTAGMRVYRARGGAMPERLFAQAQRPDGLSLAPPFQASERAQRGDLFILGTRDAFTVRAIGQLATLMTRDQRLPVGAVCEAVIQPCREANVGASAVVLRAG